jgi:hypothetical protein
MSRHGFLKDVLARLADLQTTLNSLRQVIKEEIEREGKK